MSVTCLLAASVWQAGEAAPITGKPPDFPLGSPPQYRIPSVTPVWTMNEKRNAVIAQRDSGIGSRLKRALDRVRAAGLDRANARARNIERFNDTATKFDADGYVQVYIRLESTDDTAIQRLRGFEARVELVNYGLRIVQAWVPIDRVEELAAEDFVLKVELPSYGRPRTGSATTEGDAVLRAGELRMLGVDGSGVKVGIISDGANDWPDSQALGDLPAAGITEFGSCTKEPADPTNCLPERDCNEGTALAEIIHDIAPGAAIAVGAASTSLEFIQRISDLVNSFGAHIVADDLAFFGEPYFEDGDIADAVAAVLGQVVYVSAAGNSALNHNEATYLDVDPSDSSVNLHDFGARAGGSPDWALPVYAEQYGLAYAFLQWNDPFGGSSNDYDLYVDIYDVNTNDYLGTLASDDVQNGTQDPFEATGICNPFADPVWALFYVNRFSGGSRELEIFVRTNAGSSLVAYNDPQGSVFGHPAVPGAVATGAIDVSDPGNDDIEWFSAWGSSNVYFPSFQSRAKPDLVAVDGVAVTGVGGFVSTFFGTSAAASHVAGIAALLMQAMPHATPSQIRAALLGGTVDLGAPGRDNVYGEGRIDSVLAAALLDSDGDGTLNGSDDDDDNDGLLDGDEAGVGGDPFDPDSDDDGIVDGLDRDPDDTGNVLASCVSPDATLNVTIAATMTCAATNSITVIAPAAVDAGGDLLMISPAVNFQQFSVDRTGKIKVISQDPTAPIPSP